MTWHYASQFLARSSDGVYELTGRYTDGHFAWRGRRIDSDRLIAASADRAFVEQRCEAHALSVVAESTT